jgi:hypothetical protein
MAERQQERAELVGMLRCTAGVHPHLNTDAQAMLYKAAHLLEDDGKEIARLDHERGDWTGRKCSQCSGHGRKTDEDGEERRCDACAGTGDEWLFWKDRAEKAEAELARIRKERDAALAMISRLLPGYEQYVEWMIRDGVFFTNEAKALLNEARALSPVDGDPT